MCITHVFRVDTEEEAPKAVPRFRSNPASRSPARSRSPRHGSSARASPVKFRRRCVARSPSRPARRCPGRSASRSPSKCRARSDASAEGRSAKWPEAVVEATISPYTTRSSCIQPLRRPPLPQQPPFILPSLMSPAFFLLHNW